MQCLLTKTSMVTIFALFRWTAMDWQQHNIWCLTLSSIQRSVHAYPMSSADLQSLSPCHGVETPGGGAEPHYLAALLSRELHEGWPWTPTSRSTATLTVISSGIGQKVHCTSARPLLFNLRGKVQLFLQINSLCGRENTGLLSPPLTIFPRGRGMRGGSRDSSQRTYLSSAELHVRRRRPQPSSVSHCWAAWKLNLSRAIAQNKQS